MLAGVSFHKVVFDENDLVDVIYLKVNDQFKKLTGIDDIEGKRMSNRYGVSSPPLCGVISYL